VKTIALLSVLSLSAMTSAALAAAPADQTGRVELTDQQLDGLKAGRREETQQVFLGNSSNTCTQNCDVPGRTTVTTSNNPGNPSNTQCKNCGTMKTSGPGKK
jgi:hypothetical protein